MRKIRGVKKLIEYLNSISCPIGMSTINKMIKENTIPYIRVADRVLIFDLDEIDAWLSSN